MESFKKKDIKRYHELNDKIEKQDIEELLNITYDEEVKHIVMPNRLFTKIIKDKRPEYIKYLPYNVHVKKLVRGNNIWLQKSKYLGIDEGNELTLHVDIETKHKILSLLWLLLHEFRHKLQYNLSYVKNKNLEKWFEFHDYTKHSMEHVFHEILPYETDANTFACELLEIDYPNSKFKITKETLKRLQKND